MSRVRFLLLLLILGLTPAFATAASEKIRVACVGDSITFGSGIKDRDKNSYPAQLQALLGADYVVRNFGVSGRTLLKHGDFPYWNERSYAAALAFNPNLVVIKLGTNDSKPQNWKFKSEFGADAAALIEVIRKPGVDHHPHSLKNPQPIVDFILKHN